MTFTSRLPFIHLHTHHIGHVWRDSSIHTINSVYAAAINYTQAVIIIYKNSLVVLRMNRPEFEGTRCPNGANQHRRGSRGLGSWPPALDHQILFSTNLWTIAKKFARNTLWTMAIYLNLWSQNSSASCQIPRASHNNSISFCGKIVPSGLAWNRISEHLDLQMFLQWYVLKCSGDCSYLLFNPHFSFYGLDKFGQYIVPLRIPCIVIITSESFMIKLTTITIRPILK
jgi:hypothetical protein